MTMGKVDNFLLVDGGGICHVFPLWPYLYLISACALLRVLTVMLHCGSFPTEGFTNENTSPCTVCVVTESIL